MKNLENNRTMTVEEILNDTSLSYMHAIVGKVQSTPASQLFPKKHELALMDIVLMDTNDLFEKNPNFPLKKVLTTILDTLTDDIPAPLMLKLTKKIIEKWTKLLSKANSSSAIAA